MKNKGYAKFWGQRRCIMGDVQVAFSPSFSCRWKRGWSWPCFDTTLPALLCKSCFSYANWYFFFSKIYMYKGRRFVLKEGQTQPHVHSKARILSTHWTVKWSIVHLWGYTRHSTGCFIRHPVISKLEKIYIYIYTLLFRRDSISRGFNFAISIGKYEKKEWNFVIQAFLTSFYFQTVSAY